MATESVDILVRERGARAVRRSIEQIGTGAGAARGAVQLLRSALGALAVGFSLQRITRTLANFSQEMSTLRAVTGAASSQFQSLREETKRLGSTTRFSASEAAQGATFLARAGFDTNEVLSTLGGTLTLAQAGALGLKEAADIASNVLKSFRLEVSDTQRVVDLFAFAANRGNTNVTQLGEAMKFVGPVAAGLGVEVETTTAAVTALSDAGLQASMAGTGLRRILSTLESPTSKAQKLLASLGVTTDEVRISQVGLIAAVNRLRQAGVDTGLALEIFGDRGGPAFEVLSESIGDVERLNEEMQDLEGFAAGVAAVMDDNLNGAILSTVSAAEGLVIAFGDLGAEAALESVFRGVAAALRAVSNNLEDVAEAAGFAGAALAFAFRGAILTQIRAVGTAVLVLNRAILANPIVAFGAAVASVITLLIAFQDEVTLIAEKGVRFGDVWNVVLDRISRTVSSVFEFISDTFHAVSEAATGTGMSIGDAFLGATNALIDSADLIIGTFEGLWRAITTIFMGLPEFFEQIGRRAVNGLAAVIEFGVNQITNALNVLPGVDIGPTDVGRLETKPIDIASDVASSFMAGFQQRPIRELIDGIIEDATQRADIRRIRESLPPRPPLADLPMLPVRPEAPDDPVRPPRSLEEDDGPSGPSFAEVLQDLRTQQQLMMLNNREREVATQLLNLEDQIQKDLTETQREQLKTNLEVLQQRERQANLLDQIQRPQQRYNEAQADLNELLSRGAINQEKFNEQMEKAQLQFLRTQNTIEAGLGRGIIKLRAEMADLGSLAEDTLVNAFRGAEDALVKFVTTGKADFSSLVDSILSDLARLAVRQGITGPISGVLFGESGDSLGSGLLGEVLGLGGGGGGGGATIASGGPFGSGLTGSAAGGGGIFAGLTGLLGFATGGEFSVGGMPGVDKNLLSVNGEPVARVSRGETVRVEPEGKRSGGDRPININFNISTPDAESFRRSQDQIMARAQAALRRADQRNN